MDAPLRLLLVEDSPDDADLLLRHLSRQGLALHALRVDTEAGMVSALRESQWDVVVSDYRLPQFSGPRALEVAAAFDPDLPVLIVSGTVGEESAAEVMRAGARDFVLKGSLARLSMALAREVDEATLRRSRRREAQILAQTQAIARAGGWEWKPDRRELFWTEGARELFEAPPGFVPTPEFARSLLAPGEAERLAALLARGTDSVDLEMRYRTVSGRELILRTVARVEREGATVTRLVGVFLDVTERRQLEAQLQLQDRLVAMGTIAAGVAHEINNPLTHLVASLPMVLEALRKSPSADPEIPAMIQGCLEGAERIGAVVRDLKVFSRPEDANPRCDLGEILTSVLSLLNLEYRHAARIQRAIPAGLTLRAPGARVAQILTNLIINAVQAMPPRPLAENLVELSARVDGEFAALVVADNGVGIPPESLGRVFAPFFTTKPVGVGTGLGLSICREILSGLGGTIEVESTPGQGSRFTVRLPLAEVVTAPSLRPSLVEGGRRLRVLVVDDEPMLRTVTRRVLRPHEVVDVGSAAEALAVLDGDAGFDAVLCDLMMPDGSGQEFYQEASRAHPSLAGRFVFVSGGAVTRDTQSFLAAIPPDRVVMKPFTREILRAAVQQVADGAIPG